MPEISSPIVLVGPTTVGKSEVAAALADGRPSVIINADKYGLYAASEFEIGFGLSPGELDDGRNRDLYGVLAPFDELPSPKEYAAMAKEAIERAHAAGRTAILEGCSYRYNMALIGALGVDRAVNLTWADPSGLEDKVESRARYALEHGLLEETQQALDAGLHGSIPMTSMLYRPATQVLAGTIDIEEAARLIRENGLDNARQHDKWYSQVTGLYRIAHDRTDIPATISTIESVFTASKIA